MGPQRALYGTALGLACCLYVGGNPALAQIRSGPVVRPVIVITPGVGSAGLAPLGNPSVLPLTIGPAPVLSTLIGPGPSVFSPHTPARFALPQPIAAAAAPDSRGLPVAARNANGEALPQEPASPGRAVANPESAAVLPSLTETVLRIEAGGPNSLSAELDRMFERRFGKGLPGEASTVIPRDRRAAPLGASDDAFPRDRDGNPLIVPDNLKPLLPSSFDKRTWTGRVTLHLHSHFSDGTMTPEAIIEAAFKAGVRVAALTDHDTTMGVVRAWKKAKELGLDLHPGAELTAHGGVHITAVDFDIHNPGMIRHLAGMRVNRWKKAEVIIGNLNASEEFRRRGIVLTMAEVEAKSQYAEGGTIQIPHIARVLMDKGLIRTVDEAYGTYLKGDAFNGIDKFPNPSVDEVLRVIKAAGGKAILNHPYTVREEKPDDDGGENFIDPAGVKEQDRLIEEILRKGVDGIEVYRPSGARTEEGKRRLDARVAKYLLWVDRFSGRKILVAGPGSDFHGNDTHLWRLVVWMPKNLAQQLTDTLRTPHAAAIASIERHERRSPSARAMSQLPPRLPFLGPRTLAAVLSAAGVILALAVYAWLAGMTGP